MSIVYASVAKEPDIVLCDETEYKGNFKAFAVKLLTRIQGKTRVTFVKDKYVFHILNSDGIIFLAFSIDNSHDKLGNQFLDTINQLFTDKYTKEQIDRASKD